MNPVLLDVGEQGGGRRVTAVRQVPEDDVVPLDLAQFVGGALGGAVVSAIVGPLIAQRHERRDLRASVLRAISQVERTRWAPISWEDFREAVVALRAAALVAGANREIVDYFLFLAQVAQEASSNNFEPSDDPIYTGGISTVLADLVRDAAENLVDHLWHPVRKRRSVGKALAGLQRREEALRAHEGSHDERDFPWSTVHHF